MKQVLVFVVFIFCFTLTNGQAVIKGVLKECDTDEGLIGASIYIEGTNNGTVTDYDGKFSLKISQFPVSINFSYVGYTEKSMLIDSIEFVDACLDIGGEGLVICETPTVVDYAPIHLTMPVPFMKLNTRQLQRDNDLSIAPALNRASGVYMHSGALNTNRITIRGIGNRSPFSTTKIRAYLDDIPLTTGDGETTIEDIDLSLLQKLEIWKGPTASIYGAGLGGMIHLKTNPYYSVSSLSTKFTMGSYGLFRNASTIDFSNKKETLNLKVNYNKTHNDAYRDNNEYDREGLTLLGKVKKNNNETSLLINHTQLKAFIPSSLNREDYDNDPTKAAFTWGNVKGFEDGKKTMFGVSNKTQIAKIDDLTLENKTSVFARFRNAYESRPFNILEEESSVLGLRTSFDLYSNNQSPLFPMFSIGFEGFREKYDWQTYVTNDGEQGNALSDNNEKRNYYNVFAQYYKKITEELNLLAGLNFNSTSYQYNDLFADSIDLSGDYSFDPVLSPQLGLNYEIMYNLSLFATVSHGFSPPSFSETLTPDGAINPDIQPEQGWNFELGSRGKINYRFAYEITAYTMEIRDLLVAERIGPDQFVGVNAGKTRHSGLELYLGYPLEWRSGSANFFSTYTYSDYKFIDFKNEDNDYSGNELTGTAPHNFNIGLEAQMDFGLYGNINYKYVDAFPMRDDNSIYSDAYQVVNLKVGYAKEILRDLGLDVSFGIQNLLNEKYASMILINAVSFGGNAPRYYYPGMPRNYYGAVSLKYWLR